MTMRAGIHIYHSRSVRNGCRAFSLVEILVTVALLSVIIIGLVSMFGQTQRAFTSSMTQVDVMQAGRTASDLITRDMEQMTPGGAVGVSFNGLTGVSVFMNVTNFYVDSPVTQGSGLQYLTQQLLDPTDIRTNNLQRVFFLTQDSARTWYGVGYTLDNYTTGIGTLYRYNTNIVPTNSWQLTNQVQAFLNTPVSPTNMSRLIDGVVDFRIHPYDTNGYNFLGLMYPNWAYDLNSANTVVVSTNIFGDYAFCMFSSNSVPAYVDLELGVLEDRALARYQSLTNSGTGPGTAAWNYLQNHPGQVHVFRQRITVHNINPAAY